MMLPDRSIAPYISIMSHVVSPATAPRDQSGSALPDDPHASVPPRYLALLADVAEQLLAAASPAAMVDQLFDLIRRELRLDVFFNYRLDRDRLVLEAHGGLSDAEARDGAELALGQAVCGCVARDRKAVHAIGVQSSADPLHAFVKGMGLDAYACTPLLHGDRLLGTLGFGRRWADRFTADELRFLHTVCHYVALAKYRLHTEAALREGVEARERLLGELNHRVRNALQVAVSLVSVELAGASNDAREPLRRAVDRLQVLALAHRPLYGANTPDAIDVGKLLAGLADDGSGRIVLGIIGTVPPLPVEAAAALALLVHTLLSGHAGPASVTLDVGLSDGDLRIVFRDFAVAADLSQPLRRMTTALLHQLRGRIDSGPASLALELPYLPHA